MIKRYNQNIVLIILLLLVKPTISYAQVPVLTQHGDNLRTGANQMEAMLSPATVNVNNFGKLFTRTLDANVNGQVLYAPNLTIGGVVHNVIFAYTSNNIDASPSSVYAFDADDPNASGYLWRHVFSAKSAKWTTCTPVIDLQEKIIYVLTKAADNNGVTELHALDLLTGNEKTGSPVTIAASLPGKGAGNSGGIVKFDTTHANERPGLLLLNGNVYMAFAHNSDSPPYHGWILGYHYDGNRFIQTGVFCTSPDGSEAGIWMGGMGLMADAQGNIYCSVGNGTFNINKSGRDYGMCILKLRTPDLAVIDWFTPFDERQQSNRDLDMNNVGVIGIPGTNRLFTGATKFAACFLLDSTNLGHMASSAPDKVVQRFDGIGSNSNIGQNPVIFDAISAKYVYMWLIGSNIGQFRYDTTVARFNPASFYKTTSSLTSGGMLAVSSRRAKGGILWAIGHDGVAHALDATDISKPELWNSKMNQSRDNLPTIGHFQFPTVTNGKLYVPTNARTIVAYGLLPKPAFSGNYILVNHNSQKLLYDTKSGGAGTALTQWTKLTGDKSEIWNITPFGNYYLITSALNNLAVDVSGAATTDGAALVLTAEKGTDSQLWSITATGSYYKIVNKHSGRAFMIEGASKVAGAAAVQYSLHTGTDQEWSILASP